MAATCRLSDALLTLPPLLLSCTWWTEVLRLTRLVTSRRGKGRREGWDGAHLEEDRPCWLKGREQGQREEEIEHKAQQTTCPRGQRRGEEAQRGAARAGWAAP